MLNFKPIKRIFLPENLENSRGGVNLHSKIIECVKTDVNSDYGR